MYGTRTTASLGKLEIEAVMSAMVLESMTGRESTPCGGDGQAGAGVMSQKKLSACWWSVHKNLGNMTRCQLHSLQVAFPSVGPSWCISVVQLYICKPCCVCLLHFVTYIIIRSFS